MALTVSVGFNVRVNQEGFNRHIAMFANVTRRKIGDVLKDEARRLCKDVCDFYPPFSGSAPQVTKGGEGGFGNKARDKGRAAVNRDIRKIFAPLDQAPGGLIAAKGNSYIFHLWVESKLDKTPPGLPSWIMDERNSTGGLFGRDIYQRFVESRHGNFSGDGYLLTQESEGQIAAIHRVVRGSPHYRVSKNRKPDFYIHDWSLVEKHIKKTQQRVGKLKAGWYHAGLKLGPMPTSGWIKDQGSGDAICDIKIGGSLNQITVGNKIARRYTQGWHLFQKAWNHRAFAMRVRLIHMLKGKKDGGKTLLEAIKGVEGFKIETT